MNKPHVSVFTPVEGTPIARFIFAHGAGAGMDSDFMAEIANRLAALQIEVLRFNFPYMQIMSESGKRRPPTRMPTLLEAYLAVVEKHKTDLPLFIGGKSMGGRAATMLATQSELDGKVKGVIALGYPFHPSGKPEKLRIDHLPDLTAPCLIVQGDRDALGNKAEIEGYNLPDKVQLVYLTDGDHSFKPRKASGVTLQGNIDTAIEQIQSFIKHFINSFVQSHL
jgi:predicted alpha/beta-hydrolase family hydrolase